MTPMTLSVRIEIRRRTSTTYVSERVADVVRDVTGVEPSIAARQRRRGGVARIDVSLPDARPAVKQIMERLDGETNAYMADVLNRVDVRAFDTALTAFAFEDYRVTREDAR